MWILKARKQSIQYELSQSCASEDRQKEEDLAKEEMPQLLF